VCDIPPNTLDAHVLAIENPGDQNAVDSAEPGAHR
jgi:hypothetical protein